MTIYLEYIFLENLIMDFVVLKETIEIAKVNLNNKRIMLASLISSTYVVVMFYFRLERLNYVVTKLLLAICIIYISVKPKTMKIYSKCFVLFFLVSIINVGTYIVISNIFNMSNELGLEKAFVYIFTYFVGKTFLGGLWRIYRTEINKNELNYTVKINIGGKIYTYTGFLDTGNTVYSHGVPVIFAELLDEKMLKGIENKPYFNVKTVTLGNVCTKKAYILEGIKISSKTKEWIVNAGVVFEDRQLSKQNNYNMILNYILYTESMGGIEI
ncbi:MAG: sigma-E processing peptidase SpoIIGA [Clostridia bacterium]|nr:sigma-E processing peptidase SpoIIGA [Clostridia bacterium]